jgi:hypothetical protein
MIDERVYRFEDQSATFVLSEANEVRDTSNVIECMSEWVVERDEDPLPTGRDTGLVHVVCNDGKTRCAHAFFTEQATYVATRH